MSKNLLMISGFGATALAEGKQNAFYNTLEELHKYWNRIDIICPRSKHQEVKELFGNVFIHTSPWPLIFQVKFIFRKGREIVKNNKIDLITAHEYAPFYNGIGAYLLNLVTRVPYVLEIMHIPGLPKSSSLKEFVYKYLTKFYLQFDSHKARAVRVINKKQTRDFVIDAGVPASKIHYIPAFYIDLDVFKLENIEKKYDLIYVARLEKNKGIQNLTKAVSLIKKTKPDISLLLIGSGPLKLSLKEQVAGEGLESNIHFSGWLDTPLDVAKAYNGARVFINPALNEGGPRVALEAMACGLPIVTTRVGVLEDIIQEGQNGIFCGWDYISLAQSIERMLNDKNLQQICSRNALKTVQQFEKVGAIREYAERLSSFS